MGHDSFWSDHRKPVSKASTFHNLCDDDVPAPVPLLGAEGHDGACSQLGRVRTEICEECFAYMGGYIYTYV